MAEILNEEHAHCPNCGEVVPTKIIATDEVDKDGQPRIDAVVDCPRCGRIVNPDIAN
jgi:uncharacterized Zn finger protein